MVAIASGLWWDHSKSPILAPTISLPLESGYILVAGLTILITFAGTSLWNVVAFLIHHVKAKEETTSVLDLQHQVCLRNSAGPIRTLWEATKIYHAWSKKRPTQLLLRTCIVAIPAFVVGVGVVAAGLLSSSVASKSYGTVIARLRPENCGFWVFGNSEKGLEAWIRKGVNDTIQARNYVANFYANSSSSPARPIFLQTTIPYSVNDSAPCPIPATKRCLLGDRKAFSVTSAFLDSHEMLGVNARAGDRVRVQLTTTCSPVYARDLTRTVSGPNNLDIYYLLGPITNTSESTYRYNTAIGNNTGLGYRLRSIFSYAETPEFKNISAWRPIPDFTRTDADVNVHFLSQNDIRYTGPVFDPWFSANGTFNYTFEGTLFVVADEWISTMACADQYVLCNPSTSSCTPPGGLYTLVENIWVTNKLTLNPAQLATAGRIIVALASAGTYSSVETLGPAALWANSLVLGTISPTLPDNQWMTEVLGWFQTNLAKVQASMTEFASNTAGLSPFGSIEMQSSQRIGPSPVDAESRAQLDQCANQLVQAAGGVQNFSLCGVLVIVCISVVVVLLDWTLERLVDSFGPKDSIARRARQADGKLHLLRMALRQPTNGGTGWEQGTWGVPVRSDAEPVHRPTISKGLVVYVESE